MDPRNAIKEAALFSGIVLGLSYLVFWGPIAGLQLPTASFVGGAKGPTWALILFILGGFVPSAVGLALARIREGSAGFRTLLRRGVQFNLGWRWYLAILAVIVLGTAGQILLNNLQGNSFQMGLFLTQLPAFIPLLILGPVSEEFGWRGYLLAKLQVRYSALASSVLMGGVWAFWHLPLFFMPGTSQHEARLPFLGFLIGLIAISIIMTWLNNNTRASVWAAIFFHWLYTYAMTVTTAGVTRSTPYNWLEYAPYILIALLVLAYYGPQHLVRTPVVLAQNELQKGKRMTYDDLIERFVTWAEGTADVRAALILGSRARQDHPADGWADLDLLLFVRDPDPYVQSAAWVKALAPCWLSFIERSGDNKSWERRALYEGGLDVDVALNPEEWLDPALQGITPEVAALIRSGVKVLVDKDGKLERILALPLPEPPPYQPPAEGEFLNAVNDFWFHTLWSTKHLRRGEVWRGKFCVDTYLKGLVGRMLEWHALARRGKEAGVWPHGRFLEEWADPRAVEALHTAFAHYEAGDIARALKATMALYRWLEDETAAVWGYIPPRQGEDQAARCTLELLEGWIEK